MMHGTTRQFLLTTFSIYMCFHIKHIKHETMQPGVLDKVVDYFVFKLPFCFLQLWQYHNQFTAELPSVFSELVLLTEVEGKLESPLANILNC